MSIKDVALGIGTFILILLLAVVSNAALEIYLLRGDVQTAQGTGGAACVDGKGWVNWPWPNVPTLSPPCPTAAPKPVETKAEPAETKK